VLDGRGVGHGEGRPAYLAPDRSRKNNHGDHPG